MTLVTYNICGIYNNIEQQSHKVKVQFPYKTNYKNYDKNVLFDGCVAWLGRHYPEEHIIKEEFDLDCEGEFECAENDDVIVAPKIE